MMNRFTILAVALLGGPLLTGCDGGDGLGTLPTSSEQVRAIAETPDDTAEPVAINDGAFVFTDTSEQSQPLELNR